VARFHIRRNVVGNCDHRCAVAATMVLTDDNFASIPVAPATNTKSTGPIEQTDFLGGLIHEYRRAA
jgi:hypothetical protein